MGDNLKKAVDWALKEVENQTDNAVGIKNPQDHGFVDLTRKKLDKDGIEMEPLSYNKIKKYL